MELGNIRLFNGVYWLNMVVMGWNKWWNTF
jgi:hypothetical protein